MNKESHTRAWAGGTEERRPTVADQTLALLPDKLSLETLWMRVASAKPTDCMIAKYALLSLT